jgi:ribonuclease P protein component
MLPRKLRVHKEEFGEVLKKGLSFHSAHISLRGVKKDDVSPSKFSVVASKKVAMLAVDRNLLRRRAIAVIEAHVAGMKKGISAIFSFKTGSLELSSEDIKTEVVALLKQSGLIS